MKICRILAYVFVCLLLVPGALADTDVLRAGGLAGDALYEIGGDQQRDLINIQSVILSKSGLPMEYTEYATIQEGFEALQKGEIDMLYPVTPYPRDLEPLGLAASDGVYTISWDIVFVGEYNDDKLNRIAVPGGRLAPFYCREVFPESELILCSSRVECLDAVIEGRADSAVFNGFQPENIVQNASKYGTLTYTVLPTNSKAVFVLRSADTERMALVNDCIAKTTEIEKTDYMVRSRAVSVEESVRIAYVTRIRIILITVSVFLVFIAAVIFAFTYKVILPLQEFNRCMKKNEKLPARGTPSLKRLAATYNHLYDEIAERHRLLRSEAEHDGLTGLLNRRSFDILLQSCEDSQESYMLIIVDVDLFKEINDQYGHATGDRVLKKVSSLLKGSFRDGDHVCRIGGDEFAVIAMNPLSSFDQILEKKIAGINQELGTPKEGMPAVTLSTGAARSGEGLPKETVYNHADDALYRVKNHGRGGFRLYTGE